MTELIEIPPAPTDETDKKHRFAAELLRTPDNPFRAASVVFGDDKGRALLVARVWLNDPVVLDYQRKLLDELGDMHFLPGKAEAARRAWTIATNEKLTPDEQMKALRLYSDIRGFIEPKGGVTVNQNNITQNKVMLVRDTGSAADWEQKLINQQAALISDAQRSVN